MPLKIVCDTNTLVSGFLWRGNEFQLISKAREGRVILFTSPALYAEFARVLAYPRLAHFADSRLVCEKLLAMAVFVKPRDSVAIVKEDPADDRVLECALAANADCIVSGDEHLLKLREFNGIPITTTRKALQKIA